MHYNEVTGDIDASASIINLTEVGYQRSAAGQKLCEPGLAAELGRRLAEGHLMTAGGKHGCRLHPGRTAAGDQHPFRLPGASELAIGELAAGLGVLDAGDRIALVEMADTGLIAGDAGADIVGAALLGLHGHFGIADHRPGHAAGIGLARGDDGLGDLRLVDAPGDDDGLGHYRLERCGKGRGIAVRDGHRRNDVDGARKRGGGARHDAEIVEAVECFAHIEVFGHCG